MFDATGGLSCQLMKDNDLVYLAMTQGRPFDDIEGGRYFFLNEKNLALKIKKIHSGCKTCERNQAPGN